MATAILIPTYFGSQMVLQCISSIYKNVSNPFIITYKNDEGWLKACNRMMKSVPEHDVILLNDDTLVISDIVAEMRGPDIVGGKALSPDLSTIINYGITVHPDGNTAHKYYGQPRDSVKEETQKAVEGSCMYIPRVIINEIGYLDENYGMGYRAEVDYAFRARKAGFKVRSSPTAEYVHLVSQTAGRLGLENDTHELFMKKWGADLKLGKV